MRPSVLGFAIVLVFGSACSENPTAPPFDQSRLSADLAAVRDVLAAPVVRSVGYLFFGTPLPRPAAGEPLIPDSLLGKTLTWSCATHSYAVSADTGAPQNGVRLRLYQLAYNGAIECPTTVIGQVDVLEIQAEGAARAVRMTATGMSGGDLLVDFIVARGLTDPFGTSTANGFVSDGHERVGFQSTSGYNSTTHASVSTTQVDDSARDFYETLDESAQNGVDTYSDAVDLALRNADHTLELTGTANWFNTYRSWDEVVTVDRLPFAKVGGQMVPGGDQPTITPAGLTSEQRQLVLDVVNTPAVLGTGLGNVLAIARRLVDTP